MTDRLTDERLAKIRKFLDRPGFSAAMLEGAIDKLQDLLDEVDAQAEELAEAKAEIERLNKQRASMENALGDEQNLNKRLGRQVNHERQRANNLEQQYLDVASGAIHVELEEAKANLFAQRESEKVQVNRRDDLIAELRRQLEPAMRSVDRAVAEAKAGKAALQRVRDIHIGTKAGSTSGRYCAECLDADHYHEPWPCPTIRAIDGSAS